MSEASALPRSGDGVFPEENSEIEGAMGMTSVDMTIRREVTGNFMDALQCVYCFKILQAPISVCANGHSCCGDCRTKMNICGVCRGHFVSSRNRVVENLLMACATRCDFAELGCPEIIQLDKFEGHLAECAHNPDPPQPEPEPEPEPEFQVERPDSPDLGHMLDDMNFAILQRELDYMEERMADAERSTSDILIRLSVNSPTGSVTMARNQAPAAATDRNRNDYHSEVTRAMPRISSTPPVYLPPRPRPILGAPSHQLVRSDMERIRDIGRSLFTPAVQPVPNRTRTYSPFSQVLPETPPPVQPIPSTTRGAVDSRPEYRSSFVNRTLSRPSSVRRPVLSPARFRPDRTYHRPSQRTVNLRQRQIDSAFSRDFNTRMLNPSWGNPQQGYEDPFAYARYYEPFHSVDPVEDVRDGRDLVHND